MAIIDSYQSPGSEAKRKSFAQKTGKILANRYGAVIDEFMEGWAVADDPDKFTSDAVIGIKEQLYREFNAMIEEAIAVRQAGEE